MQDFRILGTLEVIGESGPVPLGGPRPRALLAALLLRAGHVVPTEQLVDELYGAEPPKSATARSRTRSRRCGRRSGRSCSSPAPRVLLTALAGADRCASLRADAGGRERRSAGRAAHPPARVGSRSGVAHRWPSSRSRMGGDGGETSRRPPPGRGRGTDRDGDRPRPGGRRRARARALACSTRSASVLCELLMLALYRAGRQADALGCVRHGSATLAELGSSRAKGSGAPGHDPPARSGALPETAPTTDEPMPTRDREGDPLRPSRARARARRCRRSRRGLASVFGYPSERADRPRARLSVRRDDERLRAALRRAPQPLRGGDRAPARPSVPRTLAPILRKHGALHPLIVSGTLRPRDRAGVRGGRRGGRRRHVRRRRARSREVLAPAAERGATSDRLAEHVRHRVVARAPHGAAQAARRGRPVPGA